MFNFNDCVMYKREQDLWGYNNYIEQKTPVWLRLELSLKNTKFIFILCSWDWVRFEMNRN